MKEYSTLCDILSCNISHIRHIEDYSALCSYARSKSILMSNFPSYVPVIILSVDLQLPPHPSTTTSIKDILQQATDLPTCTPLGWEGNGNNLEEIQIDTQGQDRKEVTRTSPLTCCSTVLPCRAGKCYSNILISMSVSNINVIGAIFSAFS